MTIKYRLTPNKLTETECYAAKVQLTGSADLDDIVARIVDQGTTVRPPDILAVLENAIQATNSLLLEGMRVNLGGLCDLFPKISGKFTGPTDGYDPARHQVDVGSAPGVRVRDAIRAEAAVEKLEGSKPLPVLLQVADLATGEIDTVLTVGSVDTLDGNRLRFDPAKVDEGLYFVAVADGAATKVTLLQKNSPSQLVFVTPALTAAASFWLEVRTRFTENGELRSGRLAKTVLITEG